MAVNATLKKSLEILDTRFSGLPGASEPDLLFLKGVLQSPVIDSLCKVTEKLESSSSIEPVLHGEAMDILNSVTEMCNRLLSNPSTNQSVRRITAELNNILCKPHFVAVVEAHDQVAAKNYDEPGFQKAMPEDEDEDDDCGEEEMTSDAIHNVGIIRKGDEPLGMTVQLDEGRVVVARILRGGLIDLQGILRVGDIILEVNGREISSPHELMEELRLCKGSIRLKVIPSFHERIISAPCYMRALFNYDPSEDTLIPCKEIGISFVQGDVLEVLNQEDPNWWQARRTDIEDAPIGLIPSQDLEEKRKAFVRPEYDYATKTSICGTKVTKKKKKEMYQIDANNYFDKAELTLYEEVCRIPPFERKTLVLVGAQGVGRRTLKQRLISYDSDRFSAPLPHTSRPIRENEQDGKVYHFVKREIMEADISEHKYLEWGQFDGHLYGTKLDSIRAIIRSGKMCILDCNPQCLKVLKTAEFMPFVVFIAAPPIDQLRYMHEWGRSHSSANRTMTLDRALGRHHSRRARTLQSLASFCEDEDLQVTISESAKLNRTYEKYFDMILVNNNFDKTFEDLKEALNALSTEPQWVPINWVFSE
ncbi:MAGUK p55 subfamily member 6 [Tetranychus urticae]|uniref:MAGUK p55 subfamily member 6 n=1 Tax=Tetranychus urticae TaxID=32264 RepID=T1L1Y6_TETUR|nr:MAGUK p55 subfamily member 6 [Tetranychus urticae]